MLKKIACCGLLVLAVGMLCSCGATHTVCKANPIEPDDTAEQLAFKAAKTTPHRRQVAWQERELIGFIHFTVNTFTDKEWGDGTEDPAIFNPSDLDARQWVRVCKDAGMKMVILTAKHHDGFCLWPSEYTDHDIAASPWKDGKGDVVAELAQACREEGLALGLYLSPWDRHEPTYGDSPKYNQYYVKQLTELLTKYGPVAEVWMDGACGEGPNGKRQVYDWYSYFATVRKLQPDAVIFNGPDVRWVGNEAGYARETEWSVLGVDQLDVLEYGIKPQQKDLGSLEELAKHKYLVWYPAETDVSVRPGWFYHAAEDDKVKSLDKLLDIYYSSVGRNSVLLLNIPPDRRGRIHENDARRLREFGTVIRETFETNLAAGAAATASAGGLLHGPKAAVDGKYNTYWTADGDKVPLTLTLEMPQPVTFNRIMLQEQIRMGQRIERFAVEAWKDGEWKPLAEGTTVGYKRLLRVDDVTADKVRVRILDSRLNPTLAEIDLFHQPPLETITARQGR